MKKARFENIYKSVSKPVIRFIAKRIGRDERAVDEVFSNTISAAWKGFNTFEHKSSFFTWICRIALNKIADYYRGQVHERSKFVAPILEDIANIEDCGLKPEESYMLQELRVSVRRCLDILPTEKRNLLYLRYWKDMTIKKIAKTLNVPERVVEGKIYRAKKLLKKIISSEVTETSKIYLRR